MLEQGAQGSGWRKEEEEGKKSLAGKTKSERKLRAPLPPLHRTSGHKTVLTALPCRSNHSSSSSCCKDHHGSQVKRRLLRWSCLKPPALVSVLLLTGKVTERKAAAAHRTNAPARLVRKASPCLSVRIYHKHHVSEACLCIKAPFPRITRRRKSF